MNGSGAVAVFLGILLLLIAVIGSAGSLVGAFITPGNMVLNNGTSGTSGTSGPLTMADIVNPGGSHFTLHNH